MQQHPVEGTRLPHRGLLSSGGVRRSHDQVDQLLSRLASLGDSVAVSAGGFVRCVARTPHYDGVKRDAKEPAVIALFGIAPVQFELVNRSKPACRQV